LSLLFNFIFLIFEITFTKKWHGFLAKLQLFVVLPKFDQNIIFQKFKRILVKEGLNQQKMAGDMDFEHLLAVNFLWTTDKKVEVSHVHW
jgi:hypothetical protein